MSQAETEVVWLSHLKFTGLRPPAASDPLIKEQSKATFDPTPRAISSLAPDAKTDTKAYDYLSADKPGEELKSGAGIWRLYVDEAQDHDNELVEGKNKNLDLMLLFAGLFSAVLTAFLIESMKLLQEDTAETSVILLLAIVQSQQRLEQGTLQNPPPPVERPSFSAPASARWINGLWFTSLALSLSAALVGLLAKEWLTAFVASRPRSAYSYALLHQTRINGLAKWRAMHIIDILPSMLHLSLLLFSLGLTIHLWALDVDVAISVSVISGSTLVFYIATALSGALYKHCPYVTQISGYGRNVFYWAFSKRYTETIDERAESGNTDAHLRALVWLAENARDPVVMDCSYQALAGLRFPSSSGSKSFAQDPTSNELMAEMPEVDAGKGLAAKNNKVPVDLLHSSESPGSERQEILHKLFGRICHSLSNAIVHRPNDLTAWKGMNAARYASALPSLVQSLETYTELNPKTKTSDKLWSQNCQMTRSPAKFAVNALDSIWSDECPELSADSYAVITAAELRLTETIATIYDARQIELFAVAGGESLNENEVPMENQVVIDMKSSNGASANASMTQDELRARYSRALTRTAILLRFHNSGQAPISIHPLVHLLEAVYQGALCTELNPETHLSTNQPQSGEYVIPPEFNVHAIGAGEWLTMSPWEIGDEDGLIIGLVNLLGWDKVEENPTIEYATARALSTVGPILFRQWFKSNPSNQYRSKIPSGLKEGRRSKFNPFRSHENGHMLDMLDEWPEPLEPNQLQRLPHWSIYQLLFISLIALNNIENPLMGQLPDKAIISLYHRSNAKSGHFWATGIFSNKHHLTQQLIDSVSLNHNRLGQATLHFVILLSLIEHNKGTLLRWGIVRPAGLPNFLDLISKTSHRTSDVQLVFKELGHVLQYGYDFRPDNKENTGDSYLAIFLEESDGFSALLQVGELKEYVSITADFVSTVIRIAAQGFPSKLLSSLAVPEYLNAVAFAVRSLAMRLDGSEQLASLMRDAIGLLEASNLCLEVGSTNAPSIKEIGGILKGRQEFDTEILLRWEAIESWSDSDTHQFFGMSELFSPTAWEVGPDYVQNSRMVESPNHTVLGSS